MNVLTLQTTADAWLYIEHQYLKYLGVIIDEHLKWNEYIHYISSLITYKTFVF